MNYLKSKRTTLIMLATHFVLLSYILIISILADKINATWLLGVLFNKQVNIGWVLLLMTILELLSTLTFQLRILFSAKFNKIKTFKLRLLVATIAGVSWLIAGVQGIVLIGDSDNLAKTLIKLLPVFIATFNGVYISLGVNNV